MLKLGDGSVRVMVEGLERARLVEISPAEHWLVAGYETLVSTTTEDARTEALKRTVHAQLDRKSTRLNSSHSQISYAVFCLKKKKKSRTQTRCAHLRVRARHTSR